MGFTEERKKAREKTAELLRARLARKRVEMERERIKMGQEQVKMEELLHEKVAREQQEALWVEFQSERWAGVRAAFIRKLRAELRPELREELRPELHKELREEILVELQASQAEKFANLRRENGQLFDENARLRLERDAERVKQKQKAQMYYLKRMGRIDPVTGEKMYTLTRPRLTHLSPEERVQRRLNQQKEGGKKIRREYEAQHSRYNAQGRLERHCEPCEKEGVQGGWLSIEEFQPRGTGYEKECHRHAMRRRRQQEEAARPPVVVYDAAKKHAEIKEQARLRREQREAEESPVNTER